MIARDHVTSDVTVRPVVLVVCYMYHLLDSAL